MRRLPSFIVVTSVLASLLAGCGNPLGAGSCDGGCDDGGPPLPKTMSNIAHVIVVIQENHTFDNYFGNYCTAPTGSNPTCNAGPACCEAAPAKDPAGNDPLVLDDSENAAFSPDHHQACELDEIDGGKMDRFVASGSCGSKHNFAYAPAALVAPYHALAAKYALADRYFQPAAGQSSMNDMYFAHARMEFIDNEFFPDALGSDCGLGGATREFPGPTIGDLLADANVPWAFYAEGYQSMFDAKHMLRPKCPEVPPECPLGVAVYPCLFDPGDVPFEYYPRFRDDPKYIKDLSQLYTALDGGTLPPVAWVKGIGWKTEHGALRTTITDGVRFVTGIASAVLASRYASDTLLLVTYDEGGGFFDHVSPPPTSPVDKQPYGTRVPLLAIGRFAKKNYVSHTQLEHSSVVRFMEWNWLGGTTGQLGARDAEVQNLGDLLDPQATGTPVPIK